MSKRLYSLFGDANPKPLEGATPMPQTLLSISQQDEEQRFVTSRFLRMQEVDYKVDYSDFRNFVFFNSALDYFNISAEKILNEYPYDGTRDVVEDFTADLDPYQRYLLDVWPKSSGHLRFRSAVSSSYITFVDAGQVVDDPSVGTTQQVGSLSPGTGSLSVEFWAELSQSNAQNTAMLVVQKASTAGDGYYVYASGGLAYFRVSSGSITSEASVPFTNGALGYYCFTYDRSNSQAPILACYTGSATAFPRLASYTTSSIAGPINIGFSSFHVGSGSISGKVTSFISGNIDELRVWQRAITPSFISGNFNRSVYAQQGLTGLWHFNETGSLPGVGSNAIVIDSSGRKIDGRVLNYWSGVRGSGSLVPFSRNDLLLSMYFTSPEIQDLINTQQTSGTLFDRENDNAITRLVPEAFLTMELEANTTVLKDLLFILGRNFDQIKVAIDQFVNIRRSGYSEHNQTPDALLADVGAMFGWEFTGNFLNAEALQYITGRGVLANQDANKELDITLYQIKNEFWKRTLANLMHIYKTKGTRESVESLFRIYGVNKNFVRLKEYGYRPYVGISTNRIHAEKSVYSLMFSASLSSSVTSPVTTGQAYSVETRVMFPTSASLENRPTIVSGNIWTTFSGSGAPLHQLFWTKTSSESFTGSFFFSGSEGTVTTGPIAVFDGTWYNIACFRDPVSGTIGIDVKSLDYDEVTQVSAVTSSVSVVTASNSYSFLLGTTGSRGSQMWCQEARVWDKVLTPLELVDHCLNFQSYGQEKIGALVRPDIHWRLNDNVSGSAGGAFSTIDVSLNGLTGSATGFTSDVSSFRKYLFDYNYIASIDMGWTDDKVRIYDGTSVPLSEMIYDNHVVALEFNMIDALNEDISQLISTLDGFNNVIGLPANRYRSSYQDLEYLKREYFQRLQGKLNFRVFFDMLDFFDRSFIGMIQRLIPARSIFLGDELVVESHMLERPKLQWNYRRQTKYSVPEGTIRIILRR